jgi:hypothetical protein
VSDRLAPAEGSVASDQLIALGAIAYSVGHQSCHFEAEAGNTDLRAIVMASYASVALLFLNIGAQEPERAKSLIASIGAAYPEGDAAKWLEPIEQGRTS